MFGSLLRAAALTTAVVASAQAAEPPQVPPGGAGAPPTVEQPLAGAKLIDGPQDVDLSLFYPMGAGRLQRNGRAQAICRVKPDLSLENCVSVSEIPGGFGFGHSFLRLLKYKRVAPTTSFGIPVAGHLVLVEGAFAWPGVRFFNEPANFTQPHYCGGWSHCPTEQQIRDVQPKGAWRYGMADVTCHRVNLDLSLGECAVSAESPKDMGFGAAALSLAPSYHEEAKSLSGWAAYEVVWSDPEGLPTAWRTPDWNPDIADRQRGLVVARDAFKWETTPTAEDIAAARPVGLAQSFKVIVYCQFKQDGRLFDCRGQVQTAQGAATPREKEVAAAAVALSSRFKLDPAQTLDLITRHVVSYHINFQP